MRTRRPFALLLLASLATGCDDAAPADDGAAADAAPPSESEARQEDQAPEFEPLDGRFTVDTARVPGERRAP